MKIAAVGVHVLDTHVIGVESIPAGSDGQLVETIRMSAAGTAGGTALVLSRLGAEVTSYGAVGTDPIADVLLALLTREGVDVSGLVRKDEHQTSSSVIPVRPNGDRPAWHCIGANGAFTLDDLPPSAFDAVTHLHLGGPEFLGGEAAGQLLGKARAAGAVTSLDILAPGDPDMLAWVADALPHTDYLLPNDEQVLGFTGASSLAEGARALVDAGAGCVAVTQGARGALVVTADEVIEVPAYAVEVVDTTGCGDAFSAGFLRGLSLGRDLRGAAELGCAAAAQVAGGLGTDAGSYSLDSVVAFAAEAERR
ncbi:carbohydrate kinase family protein [Nocardioides sp. MAH-18]|uniref:Carbohydrate kinase family protein n=1 Tax=Nocardioides agri TaxID=2682843 RepID=A0A6L6XPP1_9ACTN|nr:MULTISPECIES: PfkB family carbohydrate kinase [unclassified Nocardioides]MBA2954440.1 carbohydrate kinase family protein [Nocardioides sp. CGMCC 1.13656]MVQ49301.1 carbohydrate kinase family protein [Nocardioides sp. MAH-18]